MSAAILMTDNWQPTVLQLMPFSNNNASLSPPSSPDRTRGYSQTRGFPTLAVTRSRSKKDAWKPVRVSSERMPRPPPPPVDGAGPQRARSEYSSRARSSLVTTERVCTINNVNDRIVSKTPELNDTPDSSDNLSTSDLPRNVKLLPKPSPCRSVDGRYFLPQNGFWRSVTMTPGEMDLQKHRDKFVKDNVQPTKNKKYKLNVNQLPRSTTPINDNDPDKLNMKQVIQYLQTKDASEESPKIVERRVKSGYPTTVSSKVAVRDSVDRHQDTGMPPMLPFRREVTSVMYTSNSANSQSFNRRSLRQKGDGDSVTKSNDSANRSSFRNTREFRLHRFLTMAPNADEFTQFTHQTHPISSANKRLLITECSKSADVETESMRNSYSPTPPYLPSRQGERYAKLHYRLPNKRPEPHQNKSTTSLKPQRQPNNANGKEGIIRLPSMLDFNNESDNDEPNDGWRKHAFAARTVSPDAPSLEVNGKTSTPSSSSDRDLSDSESSSKPPSRKVTVSLPRESPLYIVEPCDRSRRSPDPVRLSLRREQGLTREKTYMSDMAKHKSDNDEQWAVPTKFPSMLVKRETKTNDEATSRNS